jgi:hypothetical protein
VRKDDIMLQHSMVVLEGTFTLRLRYIYVTYTVPHVYVLRNTTFVIIMICIQL